MTGTPRLRYTRDEILTDPDYTRRIERAGDIVTVFIGGPRDGREITVEIPGGRKAVAS